jgi:hypothetical protein
MNIRLHIEQFVLDGISVPHEHRPLLRAAVENELARLLAEGGLASGLLAGGALPEVPAPAIQLTDQGDPVHLGQQIAQAVYGGIGE